MGFFDNVKKAFDKEIEKKQSSAMGRGRMHETDKIKGEDCPTPNKPGIYRHKNKETGDIEYVGQTDDLRKRQQEHVRNGKLDTSKQTVQYKESKPDSNKDDLLKTEKDHIKRHAPEGNKYKGGNGRR